METVYTKDEMNFLGNDRYGDAAYYLKKGYTNTSKALININRSAIMEPKMKRMPPSRSGDLVLNRIDNCTSFLYNLIMIKILLNRMTILRFR